MHACRAFAPLGNMLDWNVKKPGDVLFNSQTLIIYISNETPIRIKCNPIGRVRRKFANYFPPLVFTWAMVVWTSLVQYVFHYEAETMDRGFYTNYGSVRCTTIIVSIVFRDNEGNPTSMGDTE